jgi:hypothetical protein
MGIRKIAPDNGVLANLDVAAKRPTGRHTATAAEELHALVVARLRVDAQEMPGCRSDGKQVDATVAGMVCVRGELERLCQVRQWHAIDHRFDKATTVQAGIVMRTDAEVEATKWVVHGMQPTLGPGVNGVKPTLSLPRTTHGHALPLSVCPPVFGKDVQMLDHEWRAFYEWKEGGR